MKPEARAQNVLSTTRARAKMREFRVAEIDFNDLPRDPAILFSLAIAILGDMASTVADRIGGDLTSFPMPPGWEKDDADPQGSLRFASTFFDAYINAELNAELKPELSLLCAASYYIAGSVGSAAVIVRHMDPPNLETAGGLGFLLYAILTNNFAAIDAQHHHRERTTTLLDALSAFFRLEGDDGQVVAAVAALREYFHANGSPRELLLPILSARSLL